MLKFTIQRVLVHLRLAYKYVSEVGTFVLRMLGYLRLSLPAGINFFEGSSIYQQIYSVHLRYQDLKFNKTILCTKVPTSDHYFVKPDNDKLILHVFY